MGSQIPALNLYRSEKKKTIQVKRTIHVCKQTRLEFSRKEQKCNTYIEAVTIT